MKKDLIPHSLLRSVSERFDHDILSKVSVLNCFSNTFRSKYNHHKTNELKTLIGILYICSE